MKELIDLFNRNNICYDILKEECETFHLTAKYETINIEIKTFYTEDNEFLAHLDMTDDICTREEWLIYEECHSLDELFKRVINILEIQ